MSVWLMGCHDRDRQSWCTVTKCGNGFDDERLNKLQGELLPLMDKIKQDYSRCECPNIFFRPGCVNLLMQIYSKSNISQDLSSST